MAYIGSCTIAALTTGLTVDNMIRMSMLWDFKTKGTTVELKTSLINTQLIQANPTLGNVASLTSTERVSWIIISDFAKDIAGVNNIPYSVTQEINCRFLVTPDANQPTLRNIMAPQHEMGPDPTYKQ